jgi:hypothetical protein
MRRGLFLRGRRADVRRADTIGRAYGRPGGRVGSASCGRLLEDPAARGRVNAWLAGACVSAGGHEEWWSACARGVLPLGANVTGGGTGADLEQGQEAAGLGSARRW